VERRINEKASVTLADALDTYIESRDARLSADSKTISLHPAKLLRRLDETANRLYQP
jgi:hypothetical protein